VQNVVEHNRPAWRLAEAVGAGLFEVFISCGYVVDMRRKICPLRHGCGGGNVSSTPS